MKNEHHDVTKDLGNGVMCRSTTIDMQNPHPSLTKCEDCGRPVPFPPPWPSWMDVQGSMMKMGWTYISGDVTCMCPACRRPEGFRLKRQARMWYFNKPNKSFEKCIRWWEKSNYVRRWCWGAKLID